ncbi:MAG: S-layer homology domain-containing protein [Patescibacteria group bacterium]
MRLKTSFFLAIFLTFGVLPSPVFAANFSDVPASHAHAAAILNLKDANLVSGYPDGSFKPDQSINRAEAVAMILKAAGIMAEKSSQKISFSDVGEKDWFYPMIQKGVALGKLKGYEDKTFRPANAVTLPESLALTLSFFQINTTKVEVDAVIYSGLNSKDWYSKQAQYAKDKNLIEPDENGNVDSGKKLTRGELAEIIYRMRSVQQTAKPFDITSGWKETEHLENFWKIKHPAGWEIFKGLKNSVIWKRAAGQAFFTRTWPMSAKISISLVENPENLTADQYFAKAKENYQKNYPNLKPAFSQLTLSGKSALKISLPEKRILDAIIALPNKSFLILYGEYGDSAIGEFLKKQLETIIMSYQYVEKPVEPPKPVIPLADRLETLLQNVLVKNGWKNVAELFPDKKLVETDAIGIGTGPVDYYYSKEANRTIKLERSSGTVLNMKEGQTTAF